MVKLNGVQAINKLNGEMIEVRADYVVNASGPWTDKVAGEDVVQRGSKKIILSKGVHIVLPLTNFH